MSHDPLVAKTFNGGTKIVQVILNLSSVLWVKNDMRVSKLR